MLLYFSFSISFLSLCFILFVWGVVFVVLFFSVVVLFCFGCFQVYYSSAMSSMLLISVSALFFVSNVIYFLSLEFSFGPFIYLQFFSSALQGFSLSLEHMGDIYDFFKSFYLLLYHLCQLWDFLISWSSRIFSCFFESLIICGWVFATVNFMLIGTRFHCI